MFGNKRLDRIETAIEALIAQQAELTGSQNNLRESVFDLGGSVAELRGSVSQLGITVERVVSMFEGLIPEIRIM
jgi:hypothetical protein